MKFITDLLNLLPAEYPWNYLLLIAILVVAIFIFLPIVGILVSLFEKGQFIFISNFCSDDTANNIINKVTCIGVICHELSHAFFGLLFGAKIKHIQLFTSKRDDGVLGQVSFIPRGNIILRSFQKFFTSLAPVLVNSALAGILIYLICTKHLHILLVILFIYLIISLINHASMSGADLKLYFSSSIIVIPLVIIIAFGVTLLVKESEMGNLTLNFMHP